MRPTIDYGGEFNKLAGNKDDLQKGGASIEKMDYLNELLGLLKQAGHNIERLRKRGVAAGHKAVAALRGGDEEMHAFAARELDEVIGDSTLILARDYGIRHSKPLRRG